MGKARLRYKRATRAGNKLSLRTSHEELALFSQVHENRKLRKTCVKIKRDGNSSQQDWETLADHFGQRAADVPQRHAVIEP